MLRATQIARRVGAVAVAGALLAAAGCGDVLGFRDDAVLQCRLPSDCGPNLACANGFCTAQCHTDQDCVPGLYGNKPICVNEVCSPLEDAGAGGSAKPSVAEAGGAADASFLADASMATEASADRAPDSTPGACTDTTSDVNNCGACGHACSGGMNTQSWTCASSTCVPVCDTGWADCNGGTDGCETNIASDVNNCGRCPVACEDGGSCPSVCSSGACINGTCGVRATYGYDPVPDTSALVADFVSGSGEITMAGVMVRIQEAGVVVKIGMVSLFGGGNVYVGLYSDNGGMPDSLLTQSGSFPIPGNAAAADAESIEISVQPYQLPTPMDSLGDPYWIFVESDQPMTLQANSTNTLWYLYPLSAFGALPQNAPMSADNTVQQTPALYVVTAQ